MKYSCPCTGQETHRGKVVQVHSFFNIDTRDSYKTAKKWFKVTRVTSVFRELDDIQTAHKAAARSIQQLPDTNLSQTNQ